MRIEPTRASLQAAARALYAGDGTLAARLARWRPAICPFELLIAEVPHGATVLDVGCGGGLFLGLLAADGRIHSGLGVDPSVPAISAARAMAERHARRAPHGSALDFRTLGPGETLPAGPFDVVSLVDVLHHVAPRDQLALVRHALERVAPGGRFIYKDMARRPRLAAVANRLHDAVMARQWIHYLPIDAVANAAREAGFTIVVRRDARRFVYAHELLVCVRPQHAVS